MTTINKEEIQKFSSLAEEWWDIKGKFKPLHMFNPIRIEYITQMIRKHFKISDKKINPFKEYFGFDVRKVKVLYPKYDTHMEDVRTNLWVDKEIQELKENIKAAQKICDAPSLFDHAKPFVTKHGNKLAFAGTFDIKTKKKQNPWLEIAHDDIWHATRLGVVDTVKAFLEKGKSPDAQTTEGETCMHILSVIGDTPDHLKIVNLLLEYGSDVGVQTNHGYTPIM